MGRWAEKQTSRWADTGAVTPSSNTRCYTSGSVPSPPGWSLLFWWCTFAPCLVEPFYVAAESFQLGERLTAIKGQVHSDSDYDDNVDEVVDDDSDDGEDYHWSCGKKENHGRGVLKGSKVTLRNTFLKNVRRTKSMLYYNRSGRRPQYSQMMHLS